MSNVRLSIHGANVGEKNVKMMTTICNYSVEWSSPSTNDRITNEKRSISNKIALEYSIPPPTCLTSTKSNPGFEFLH